VQDAGDTVIENSSEGADTVFSKVNWTLSANVENLTFDPSGLGDSGVASSAESLVMGSSGSEESSVPDSPQVSGLVIGSVIVITDPGLPFDPRGYEGTGNNLDNVIRGYTGKDRLRGMDGDDRLYGAERMDRLDGGAGDDLLDGGSGVDHMV